MLVRVGWLVDGELVSERILTNEGIETILRILNAEWTVSDWKIVLGSDPSPEDITDDAVSELASKTASRTVTISDLYGRIEFSASFTAAELADLNIGELGLVCVTSSGDKLVDRTMHGPVTYDADKTFTCFIEIRRW